MSDRWQVVPPELVLQVATDLYNQKGKITLMDVVEALPIEFRINKNTGRPISKQAVYNILTRTREGRQVITRRGKNIIKMPSATVEQPGSARGCEIVGDILVSLAVSARRVNLDGKLYKVVRADEDL